MGKLSPEAQLEATVMTMARAVPADLPLAQQAALLVETMDVDGDGRDRTDAEKIRMLGTVYAVALKIINRSILNTPTENRNN